MWDAVPRVRLVAWRATFRHNAKKRETGFWRETIIDPQSSETAKSALAQLAALGNPAIAEHSQRFFKTGPGEYGEGDRFFGVRVPQLRKLSRQFRRCDESETKTLLESEFHEARLLALLICVLQYQRGDDQEKRRVYDFYHRHLDRVNNWDLVDSSASQIVGDYLRNRSRRILHRLAGSPSLWRRRIAIIATLAMIKEHDFAETFALAERLLHDPEDLLHKAVGWMLREIGNRDEAAMTDFLDRHAACMPRTMLRYAIERLEEPQRQQYLALKNRSASGSTAPTDAS